MYTSVYIFAFCIPRIAECLAFLSALPLCIALIAMNFAAADSPSVRSKQYTLVLDLDETLVLIKAKSYQKAYVGNKYYQKDD